MSNLVNSHIFDKQREQREKILKSYGIGTEIEKSKGEGSRGGRVIGHTRSGKPIYSKKIAEEYSSFSKKDHEDAAKLHKDLSQEYFESAISTHSSRDSDKAAHHESMSVDHENEAFSMKKSNESSKRLQVQSDKLKKAYEVLGMTNIFEKGEEVKMDKKDFVDEHEDLIETLKTPTKKDDKKEIKEQSKELEDVLDRDK